MIDAYRGVAEHVGHELFPCPFAKKSARRGSQWFAFIESLARDALVGLRSSLLEYLRISELAADRERLLMPLVVLVHPESCPATLPECHAAGWKLLQDLHDLDPREWPVRVPSDPDSHLWSFCFRGVQLFVNFSSSRHVRHRSRNLGRSMAFVINPRENFDKVAGNNPEGHAVRGRIRKRIEIYDGGPVSPELGTYGQVSNREWRQYAIGEGDTHLPDQCPLTIRGRR